MKTTCNSKNDGILSFDTPESLFLWNELVNITSSCHQSTYKLNNFNWNKAAKRPRTLVCHDHCGGYLEYESLQGITCSSLPNEGKEHQIPIYSFFHWWYIDVFVYFSHHFVTVPPDVWILAAHQHGVLILGTFIIESVALFNQCFSDDSITDKIVSSLVVLCKNMNFDGWLINIENPVDSVYLDRLEWFLKKLRRDLRDYVHNCTQVIWYDSVVNSGKLRWQNELNKDNMRWFSAVDGFYTNYGWTECHLERTLETFYKNFSEDKSLFDIYIGIDVFGRDCTGGWECFKPLEIIRRYNFSAAIFAPGWICETCPKMDQKISLFDNSESLFLCNILIEQTDRYLKLSYKSSFPVEFVIEVSNSLNVEHLLVKTKEKFVEQTEGVQEKMIKFSSHFNNKNTEGEEQKQIDEEYFAIENHLELNLQQKSGWYIKKIILWVKNRSNFPKIENHNDFQEKRLFYFEMNLI
uniref:Mannosyl-glycoprotein endo-beta-N-acetylglucosaminidase n=1 Tax=Meloidogyne javanica TaxID=6303 RepID=A0A915MD35_MELJA